MLAPSTLTLEKQLLVTTEEEVACASKLVSMLSRREQSLAPARNQILTFHLSCPERSHYTD
jgi:hypothetical protein